MAIRNQQSFAVSELSRLLAITHGLRYVYLYYGVEDNDGINDSSDLEDGDFNEMINHIHTAIHRVSSLCPTTPRFTNEMPHIKKRPNLKVFRETDLYREIKMLNSLPCDNLPPNDRWSLFKLIQERENGIKSGSKTSVDSYTPNECRRIRNLYLPNHRRERILSLESKIFCGTFSKDGSKLITGSQDNIIRILDSSKGTYHSHSRIAAQDVSWCIVDIDFSPDAQHFVYSTWSNYLHVVSVNNPDDNFQRLHLDFDHARACIFAVRFSPCGKYIIGGSNDGCIYVYDRISDRRVERIKSTLSPHIFHHTDVNAVAYTSDSSNLIVSGCDNGIIKMWDLRSDTNTAVGMYSGHMDGITYIDTRGDMRYILSNSKDQSIKIWDLRRFSPKDEESAIRLAHSSTWDYRWDIVPREYYNPSRPLEGDTSIMTYRGHRVTKTLIRAKFSPAEQTGQRYIYTGCGTGRVIIYDVLTGCIKEAIGGHKDVVRDVAWHPDRCEIISSSWDSHVNLNTFKRHIEPSRRRQSTERIPEEPVRRSRRLAASRRD